MGLDFYYEHSPQALQRQSLSRFIEMARALHLPLVIHDRGAGDACYEILQSVGQSEVAAVIHCFTGTLALAKRYLDLGALLSFTGIITFKNAEDVREVVRYTPLDRLMIETDSPYLAPVPYRGKRNEPAYVVAVAKKVAEVKALSLDDVAAATTATARRFFRLADSGQ